MPKIQKINRELLNVAKGCLGYLQALPPACRPDKDWFTPLREAIARADTLDGRGEDDE